MAGRLDGKVALITGAASGIGRASALAFAREGARVVVSDVAREGGEETARLVEAAGGSAAFVAADVTQPAQVEELIAQAVGTYGRLDCALNNAGIEGALAPTAEYPLDAWNAVIAVNLTGVWLCLKYELAQLLIGGGGAIVNVASAAGVVAMANAGAYTASKHGVIGLTKAAAVEYGPRGIRVNAVCPGWTETPMLLDRGIGARHNPALYQRLARTTALKRLGRAEEIANTAVWLCSDEASFVTGHALLVDGGITAQ